MMIFPIVWSSMIHRRKMIKMNYVKVKIGRIGSRAFRRKLPKARLEQNLTFVKIVIFSKAVPCQNRSWLVSQILPDNHSVLKSQCTSDDDDGGKRECGEEEEEEEEERRGGGGGGRWRWSLGGSWWRSAEGVFCDHPLLLPILMPAPHPGEE